MADLPAPTDAMGQLLASMSQFGASDLHLKVGYSPFYRIAGALRKTHMAPLPNHEYVEQMLAPFIPQARRAELEKAGALDFSVTGKTGDRYRINVFQATGEVHASIRRVQSKIPSIEELDLPPVYHQVISQNTDGLILVSGITGSGKSSTLAALVAHVNEIRSMHVVTIEDPIEFVFKPVKAIISQREIGIDVPTFAEALRHVVRQDPDCILIGEMRDRETMTAALQAAETGHLVLGSLHVADAPQTFTRILEFFPHNEHGFIRSALVNSLRAILCQRLVPGVDEGSRYPATEVLLANGAVREKILKEEDNALPSVIAGSRGDGMRSFADSLVELIESGKIYYDTAMDVAPNREALAAAVKGIKSGGQGLVGRR